MPERLNGGAAAVTVIAGRFGRGLRSQLPGPGLQLTHLLSRLGADGVEIVAPILGWPAVACAERLDDAPTDEVLCTARESWLRKDVQYVSRRDRPELWDLTAKTSEQINADCAALDAYFDWWHESYRSGRPLTNPWACSRLAFARDIFGVDERPLAECWGHMSGTDSGSREDVRRWRTLDAAVSTGREINAQLGAWPWSVLGTSLEHDWWTRRDVSLALYAAITRRTDELAAEALRVKRAELALATLARQCVDEDAGPRFDTCITRVMDLEADASPCERRTMHE